MTRLYKQGVIDIGLLSANNHRIIEQHLQTLRNKAQQHLTPALFALLRANTREEYREIEALPGDQPADLEQWQVLKTLLLTTENKWRKTLNKANGFPPEVKVQKQAFVDLLLAAQNDELLHLLSALDHLPDVAFSTQQVDALSDIAAVLKLALAQLDVLFAQAQKCDFIQVALDALGALGGNNEQPGEVALFLDYQLEHLLIDEFQDTSIVQFSLIRKLIDQWSEGDGRTLFLVGDPMQSIYRFRESQVGLFLQVRDQGIGPIRPKFLQLSYNFRSSAGVVTQNNHLFAKIFPKADHLDLGAIKYSDSEVPESAIKEDAQAICYHGIAHKRYDLEAKQVVELITRDSQSQEIAIIARGRRHLQEIIAELKTHQIEFEALKMSALKEHLFTRDLMALTRALLDMGDRLAWFSVLRAPWCGLLLEDILLLSTNQQQLVFDQLGDEQVLSTLSDDGAQRAKHLHQALEAVVLNQSRFDFVELLSYALDALSPSTFLSSQEQTIQQQYLRIVGEAATQHTLEMSTIEGMLDELYAPSTDARVKVMTIHESKGLEFDTVIIPGLGRVGARDQSELIYLQEFSDGSLLLAPTKSYQQQKQSQTYQYLRQLKSQQDDYEMMRLLYVAMTRAKRQVHLFACAPSSNKAPSKSFLQWLMPQFSVQFSQLQDAQDIPEVQRIAPKLLRYQQLPSVKEHTLLAAEQFDHTQMLENLYKQVLGILLHQYYEFGDFETDTQQIEQQLLEAGLSQDQAHEKAAWVAQLLENTTTDSKFDWLFAQRESSLSEAEFATEQGSIVVDRLFIDQDVLWIIDFKTAALLEGETIEQYIQRQQQSHQRQLQDYQQVLAQIYTQPIRCALYCPAVQQLIHIGH